MPLPVESAGALTLPDRKTLISQASESKSAAEPFSTVSKVVDAKGRPLRRFDFPRGVDLGYISINGSGVSKVRATGIVDFPADAKLTFYPTGTFLQNSRYFPRFLKGDVDCLKLTNVMAPELQAATHIVGVRSLIIESSAYIDDGCVGLISKFEDLDSLQVTDSDLTGEGIARLPSLLKLNHLTMTASEDVDNLCRVLERSRALTYLKFASIELSDADIVSIGKIANLRQLKIKGQELSPNNLQELSKLSHLVELEIPTTKLTPAAAEILHKFPALKRVRVAPMSKHDMSLVSDMLKDIKIEASSHATGL